MEDLEKGVRPVEVDEDLPGAGQFSCVECRFPLGPAHCVYIFAWIVGFSCNKRCWRPT